MVSFVVKFRLAEYAVSVMALIVGLELITQLKLPVPLKTTESMLVGIPDGDQLPGVLQRLSLVPFVQNLVLAATKVQLVLLSESTQLVAMPVAPPPEKQFLIFA